MPKRLTVRSPAGARVAITKVDHTIDFIEVAADEDVTGVLLDFGLTPKVDIGSVPVTE